MKISLIPWEIIWLTCLILLVMTVIRAVVIQVKLRRLSLKQNWLVYLLLLLTVGIPYTLPFFGYRFILSQNAAEYTDAEHAIPALQSRIYDSHDIDTLYRTSLRVAQGSRSYGQPWRVAFADLSEGYSGRIVVQVPTLWQRDELTITIQHRQTGVTREVFLYSLSPGRERDLGENARHIKRFYEALDQELAKIGQ